MQLKMNFYWVITRKLLFSGEIKIGWGIYPGRQGVSNFLASGGGVWGGGGETHLLSLPVARIKAFEK